MWFLVRALLLASTSLRPPVAERESSLGSPLPDANLWRQGSTLLIPFYLNYLLVGPLPKRGHTGVRASADDSFGVEGITQSTLVTLTGAED